MHTSRSGSLKRRPWAVRSVMLGPVLILAILGCTSIWNAGDLAVWVRDQAVKEGCRRETIVLDDWYTATDEGNVWRGTCKDADGNPMAFGIDVDPVWTPSQ